MYGCGFRRVVVVGGGCRAPTTDRVLNISGQFQHFKHIFSNYQSSV